MTIMVAISKGGTVNSVMEQRRVRRVTPVAIEDRPMRSLSAEELFAAAVPMMVPPIGFAATERFWRREQGLRLVLDELAYDYWSRQYPSERLCKIDESVIE